MRRRMTALMNIREVNIDKTQQKWLTMPGGKNNTSSNSNSDKQQQQQQHQKEKKNGISSKPLPSSSMKRNLSESIQPALIINDNNSADDIGTISGSSFSPATRGSYSSSNNGSNSNSNNNRKNKNGGIMNNNNNDQVHQQQQNRLRRGSNASGSTNTTIIAPPTDEEIKLALCAIDDTRRYKTEEVLEALKVLHTWRDCASTTEANRISNVYIDLGGPQRTLDFIKKKRNDTSMILESFRVLTALLDPGQNDDNLNSSLKIAKKFVDYKGIELMLIIIRDSFVGSSSSSAAINRASNDRGTPPIINQTQLKALLNIWGVFAVLIYNINKRRLVDLDSILSIIDSGILTLDRLGKIVIRSGNTSAASNSYDDIITNIKCNVTITFARVMENSDMIEMGGEGFLEKNMFEECIRALKINTASTTTTTTTSSSASFASSPDNGTVDNDHDTISTAATGANCNNASSSSSSSWRYKKGLWGNTSLLFYNCCKDDRTLLSKESDFLTIVPFLIHFVRESPNFAWEAFAFDLLHESCDVLGSDNMANIPGVFEVLGPVADSSTSNVANDDVKHDARKLLQRLLKRYDDDDDVQPI